MKLTGEAPGASPVFIRMQLFYFFTLTGLGTDSEIHFSPRFSEIGD